ncbi:MAG: class I SAM-dependent methyltransferase [Clostridiaceae bacterium]
MDKGQFLFTAIAPIYGRFFNYQIDMYKRLIKSAPELFSPEVPMDIVDVGCGTGALAAVLSDMGHQLTGVDGSWKMIDIAVRKTKNQDINFIVSNATKKIPLEDKSFDMAITSFVAHGFKKEDRLKLYSEMERLSKKYIVISDYNKKRALLTSIAEFLESGDYFNFIKEVEEELKNRFGNLKVINNGRLSAFYVIDLESRQ